MSGDLLFWSSVVVVVFSVVFSAAVLALSFWRCGFPPLSLRRRRRRVFPPPGCASVSSGRRKARRLIE